MRSCSYSIQPQVLKNQYHPHPCPTSEQVAAAQYAMSSISECRHYEHEDDEEDEDETDEVIVGHCGRDTSSPPRPSESVFSGGYVAYDDHDLRGAR
jgi:hypothetical protein